MKKTLFLITAIAVFLAWPVFAQTQPQDKPAAPQGSQTMESHEHGAKEPAAPSGGAEVKPEGSSAEHDHSAATDGASPAGSRPPCMEGMKKKPMMMGMEKSGMQGKMSGMMPGMMSGMMQGGREGMKGEGRMMGAGAGNLPSLMGPFHGWTKRLMMERVRIGLTPDQLEQINDALMEHVKTGIMYEAGVRVMEIDLKQALRKKPADIQSADEILKKLAEGYYGIQSEGIKLYSRVLQILTDEQKVKAEMLVGSPFPAPWMRMGAAGGAASAEEGAKEGAAGGHSH